MCVSTIMYILLLLCDVQVSILSWSPLAAGWLTGTMNRKTADAPADSRIEWATKFHFPGTNRSIICLIVRHGHGE